MESVSDDQNFVLSPEDKKKRPKSVRYLGASVSLDYAGTTVWVSDEKSIWAEATVLEQIANMLVVQKKGDAEKLELDGSFEEIHKINPKVVPDMAELNFLHEPGILYNLSQRALTKNPYTYMGTVLIAVNPLRTLLQPSNDKYIDKPWNSDIPHPNALAELAYQQLCFSHANQCLVVSGESGAGKTETAKILLKFIADRSPLLQVTATSDIDKRMLQSSPLLESFGNAKTGRNNNSSRFGKLMKIYFKSNTINEPIMKNKSIKNKMSLAGVAIETYLLEKSRVVGQNEGERNYHIFYQLLSAKAVNDNILDSLNFSSDFHSYRILKESNCIQYDGSNDLQNFKITHTSLQALGLKPLEIQGIYSILVGLLNMGNIVFVEEETEAGEKAKIQNRDALTTTSNALGIRVNALEELLTQRTLDITANKTANQFTVRLNIKESIYARDACIKSIYEHLFNLIVSRINDNLSSGQTNIRKNNELSSISILDIYGFETFEINSFEQFLINYANESLQNTFNVQIFDAELKLFAEENITCNLSSQPENNGCIELIAAKTNSIFATLDSICQLPQPSDLRFVEELHKVMKDNRYFPPVHVKDKKNTFYIKHFAGKIKYTVGSIEKDDHSSKSDAYTWVNKNNDAVPDKLREVCESSMFDVVKTLFSYIIFDDINDDTTIIIPNAPGGGGAKRRRSRIIKGPIASTEALKSPPNMINAPSNTNSGNYSQNASFLSQSSSLDSNIHHDMTTSSQQASLDVLDDLNTTKYEIRNQINKTTIATSFSYSMFKLNTYLIHTNCLFIRCIKPNTIMKPDYMDNEFIVNQLRALGILQTCEVLKLGMPTRIQYKDLIEALQPLLDKLPKELISTTEPITLIACLMWAFDVKNDLFKLGRTRVFFRAGQFDVIEQMLQIAKTDTFEMKSNELIKRIQQAVQFKKKADQLAFDLEHSIKEKEKRIQICYNEVERALICISKAPIKHVEVSQELLEIASSCEKLIFDSKRDLIHANTEGNAAMIACNKVLDKLDPPTLKDYEKIKLDLDKLNKKVQKAVASHIRTMTRYDALSGRNDRVKDVAHSLNDVLMIAKEILEKAYGRISEIKDGGLRCDIKYAEERAKVCEEHIEQVRFKTEGVELDLKEIFEVFGEETKRVDAQVALNFVKKIFIHELRAVEEINKELIEYLHIASKLLQNANYIYDPSTAPNPNAKKLEKLKSVQDMMLRSRMSGITKQLSKDGNDLFPNASGKKLPPVPEMKGLSLNSSRDESDMILPIDSNSSNGDLPTAPPPAVKKLDSNKIKLLEKLRGTPFDPKTPSGKETILSLKDPSTPLTVVPPTPPDSHIKKYETPIKDEKTQDLERATMHARMAEQSLIDDALMAANNPSSVNPNQPHKMNTIIRPHTDLEPRHTPSSLYNSRHGIVSLAGVGHHNSTRGLNTMSIRMSPASSNNVQSPIPSTNSANPTTAKKRLSIAHATIGSAASVMAGGIDFALYANRRPESKVSLDELSTTDASTLSTNTDRDELPEGWKEYFDPNTKRPYYVHKATKTRQWKRPTAANPDPQPRKRRNSGRSETANSEATDGSFTESTTSSVHHSTSSNNNNNIYNTSSSSSSYISNVTNGTTDRNAIMSLLRADLSSTSGGGKLTKNGLFRERIPNKREYDQNYINQIKDHNIQIGLEFHNNGGYISLTKMNELGNESKNGYLMKQSSILGRWRKRWFVLDGGRFEYYDRQQDETSQEGKTFLLNSESIVMITPTENCFCIKANEESDETRHWYLIAKDDNEMDTWITALNSHIHLMYLQENNLFYRQNDLWQDGIIEQSFWKIIKNSFYKRTFPKTNAPRTGEVLSPGEIVECVQTINSKSDFNTYLRLWGDRGWIYEKHPKARYPLIQKVHGEFIDEGDSEYVCVSNSHIPIFSGPSFTNSKVTVHVPTTYIHGDILRVNGIFKEIDLDNARGTLSSTILFLKLTDGAGWVPLLDPKNRMTLFQKKDFMHNMHSKS